MIKFIIWNPNILLYFMNIINCNIFIVYFLIDDFFNIFIKNSI